MKSRVHPTYKTTSHVQHWAAYDRALVCRGDITLWVSPAAIAAWDPGRAGTRGAQRKYSDLAIESTLTRRLLFHRPRRQTEGCLTSLFVLLGLDLRAPDHTITTVKSLGRRRWKQTSHDPQHARVENACFRDTSIIGDGLRARTPGGRTVEAPLACTMLNAMPDRGRPASYAVGR